MLMKMIYPCHRLLVFSWRFRSIMLFVVESFISEKPLPVRDTNDHVHQAGSPLGWRFESSSSIRLGENMIFLYFNVFFRNTTADKVLPAKEVVSRRKLISDLIGVAPSTARCPNLGHGLRTSSGEVFAD